MPVFAPASVIVTRSDRSRARHCVNSVPDAFATIEIDGRSVGVGAFASSRILVTA